MFRGLAMCASRPQRKMAPMVLDGRERPVTGCAGARSDLRVAGALLGVLLLFPLTVVAGRVREAPLPARLIGATQPSSQVVGQALPPWQPGTLDIHVINTGRGDAALLVLPDGTTLQFDAGDGGAPVGSPRGVAVLPDTSRPPGEWIARYVTRVLAPFRTPGIDYAVLSHLHDDHMGAFPELARHVLIRKMLDRGWPDYAGAGVVAAPSGASTYLAFARADASRMERFVAGRHDQITLLRSPASQREVASPRTGRRCPRTTGRPRTSRVSASA
jgi:hypothetical protein